jgi:hypothetical protein
MVILLASCAAPAPKPELKPTCFAPAGFYMVFGGLRKHDCAVAPKDTLVGLREVLPRSLPCGSYRSREIVEGIGELVLELEVSARGLSGNLLADLGGCRALYEAVFLRMR